MGHKHIKLAIILGMLALAGPFAIDMYLPALPKIAADLGVGESAAQVTLMAFFIPFGIAQMFYGPWADQVGRKPPIYFGMGLFGVGAVGAALAGSLETLVFWRVVQGAGGAVAMVVPRAIIRDVDTGPAATRLMAMLMLVIAVSPLVAPLAGSLVETLAGWRAIFWVIAGMSVISLLLAALALRESLAVEDRVRFNFANMRSGSIRLLGDGKFVGLTIIGALGTSSFFIFLSMAPFVYIDAYGLTPTQFSLAFALNAVGFFAASQMAAPLGERIGMDRVILLGSSSFALLGTIVLVIVMSGFSPLWFVIGGLFFANAGLGLVIPSVAVMALDDHGPIAGLASSLGGTLQMTIGGVSIAVAGPFMNGTALPMVASMTACAVLGFGVAVWTLRMRKTAAS